MIRDPEDSNIQSVQNGNSGSQDTPKLIKEVKVTVHLVNAIHKFFNSNISEQESHDKAIANLTQSFYESFPDLFEKFDEEANATFEAVFVIHYYHTFIKNLSVFDKKVKDESTTYQSVNLRSLMRKIRSHNCEDMTLENAPAEAFDALYDKSWRVNHYPVKSDVINEDLQSIESMNVPSDLLKIAISGKGKFDLYITSYLCKGLNLSFFQDENKVLPWVFDVELLRGNAYLNGFASVALDHTRRTRCHLGFSEELIKCYKINLIKKIGSNPSAVANDIKTIQNDLKEVMSKDDPKEIQRIEEYLVGAIGCEDAKVSKYASNTLGCLKTGQDWMKRGRLEANIKEVGEELRLQLLIERNKHNNKNAILVMDVPSAEYDFHENNTMYFLPTVLSFSSDDISAKTKLQNKSLTDFVEKVTAISHSFGKAFKAGFYAYRLVEVAPEGWVNVISTSIGQDKPAKRQKSDSKDS